MPLTFISSKSTLCTSINTRVPVVTVCAHRVSAYFNVRCMTFTILLCGWAWQNWPYLQNPFYCRL